MSQAIQPAGVISSSSAGQQEMLTLLDLPQDMISEVLMNSDIAAIGALRQTSRQFEVLLQDEGIWRRLFRRDFPSCRLPPFPSFRESYFHRHRFHTNFANAAYTTREIRGDRNPIFSLAFSDTKIIAACRSINIYDAATGQKCLDIPGDGNQVYVQLVSGDLLFAATAGGTINVYNLANGGRFVKSLDGHHGVLCLGFYAGHLISGCHDSTIRICNVDTEESECLQGHTSSVTSLVVADGMLYTGSKDKTIRAWDLKEKKFSHVLGTHESDVMALVLVGETLVSGSFDRSIKFWDLKERQCLRTLLDTRRIEGLASREGEFVSSSDDKRFRLWRDKCLGELYQPLQMCDFAFLEDKLVAAGTTIRVFDFQAKDEDIFAEIAGQFKSPNFQKEAALRFIRMPKKAQKEIFLHLHQIIAPHDSLGTPDETFLELCWNSATPQQKAQAIEAYLARFSAEKKEINK